MGVGLFLKYPGLTAAESILVSQTGGNPLMIQDFLMTR